MYFLIGLVLAIIVGVIIPLHLKTINKINSVQKEIKDFHGRLCAIEERIKK